MSSRGKPVKSAPVKGAPVKGAHGKGKPVAKCQPKNTSTSDKPDKVEKSAPAVLEGITIEFKKLGDDFLDDKTGKIKESARWPILIDGSEMASTFLRYRNANYLNPLNQNDMKPDSIRIALLGALKYGKPLVVDLTEVEAQSSGDIFKVFEDRLNEIDGNLSKHLFSKDITDSKVFMKLVRDDDPEEYGREYEYREKDFTFTVITKADSTVPDSLLNRMFPVRVNKP